MAIHPTEIDVEGQTVLIEVSELEIEQTDTELADAVHQVKVHVERAGEVAAETARRLHARILASLRGPSRPREITVDFGISFGGEAGVPFFSKASGEATFKVSLTWDLEEAAPRV